MSRILTIEDEKPWLQAIEHILNGKQGHLIICAKNREEAFREVEKEKPDLILLDIKIGDEQNEGINICYEFKRNPKTKDTPVIMVTIKNDMREESQKAGAVDYVIKSHMDAELKRKVEAILNPPLLIELGTVTLTITDPFDITVKDASKITLKDYKKLFGFLKSKYKELIEDGFKNTNAMDIVLCDREVVADSNISGGLTEDMIDKIEKEKKKVCYIIGRGDYVEEIWNVCPIVNEDDAYPTIPIYLGGSGWNKNDILCEQNKINASFDTGNPRYPHGFLAFPDKCREFINEKLGIKGNSRHLGKDYYYNLKKVKIGVVDKEEKSQCMNFQVRFVNNDDWWVFQQTDRNRTAFVGRELLFGFLFCLTLNPKDGTSTLQL